MDQKLAISFAIILVFLGAVMYLASREGTVARAEDLLKVNSTGGLCLYGTCDSEWLIKTDGSYIYKAGGGEQTQGKFSSAEINDLKSLIGRANFREIKSRPFTDICPIAYDGQQYMYNFLTEGETIDSCVVDIDENAPLWKRIQSLLNKTYQ